MRKILFFIFLLYFGNILYSQPVLFNRMYKFSSFGSGNRFHQVIRKDSLYYSFGQYDTQTGYLQPLSAKIDSLGNLIQYKTYSDTLKSYNINTWNTEVNTFDTCYIISGTIWEQPNINKGFIIKLDNNLNMKWRKYYFDSNLYSIWSYPDYIFYSLKNTSDNGFIVVGNRINNSGKAIAMSIKYDSLGNQQWLRTFNENYYWSVFYNVIPLTNDEYLFGGGISTSSNNDSQDNVIVKIDSSGNVLWNKILGGAKGDGHIILEKLNDTSAMILMAKCDSAFVTGSGSYFSYHILNFYKLSLQTGDTLWGMTFGPLRFNQINYSFRVFPDGSAIASGSYGFAWDNPWLLKLSSEGAIEWYKEYSLKNLNNFNNFRGQIFDLQQTKDKGYVICGEIANTDSIYGNCGWILKIDAQGNWQDSSTYIMPGIKLQSSIALYPNPASNQLTVSYFQEMEEAVLEIYNTLGIKQMEVKLPQGQSSFSFSISHLAKGYYKAILKEKSNIRGQQGLVISE